MRVLPSCSALLCAGETAAQTAAGAAGLLFWLRGSTVTHTHTCSSFQKLCVFVGVCVVGSDPAERCSVQTQPAVPVPVPMRGSAELHRLQQSFPPRSCGITGGGSSAVFNLLLGCSSSS